MLKSAQDRSNSALLIQDWLPPQQSSPSTVVAESPLSVTVCSTIEYLILRMSQAVSVVDGVAA
jgi:hypothetical protein